jgi:hypothetical protein
MSFNPEAPGVADLTKGFGLLVDAGYSDVPMFLERFAEILETKRGREAFHLIVRGAEECEKNTSAANVIKFMANCLRSSLAKGIVEPEGSEWPEAKEDKGVLFDLTGRRLN